MTPLLKLPTNCMTSCGAAFSRTYRMGSRYLAFPQPKGLLHSVNLYLYPRQNRTNVQGGQSGCVLPFVGIKWKVVVYIRSLYCSGTFVLMSTKVSVQPDVVMYHLVLNPTLNLNLRSYDQFVLRRYKWRLNCIRYAVKLRGYERGRTKASSCLPQDPHYANLGTLSVALLTFSSARLLDEILTHLRQTLFHRRASKTSPLKIQYSRNHLIPIVSSG